MIRKIAVITPQWKEDYLANTVLDGLEVLLQSGEIESYAISSAYPARIPLTAPVLPGATFSAYAQAAEVILLLWGKKNTDWKLAEQLGLWAKTAFIDGSEPGGDRRFDVLVQRAVLAGDKRTEGAVNLEMLRTCAAYFRREKPMGTGIESLPFGIERRYGAAFHPGMAKDIDFCCIFGQDKCPLLRREVTRSLREFCAQRGLRCVTEKVPPEQFYQLLARSKVGVSVGGGGYDTARFWEILGNNCLLMTERIDLVAPPGTSLAYQRIKEFNNLYDFVALLPEVEDWLRRSRDSEAWDAEFQQVLREHSAAARVRQILRKMSQVVGAA
jgi:hypothetical protein